MRTHLTFLLLLFVSAFGFAKEVVYPGHERNEYLIRLLDHALSYHPTKGYKIVPFGSNIPKHRSYELMQNNDGIDVVLGTGLKSRVDKYQAVHFPLLKGLNGLRIPLVSKKNKDLFKDVTEEAQLRQLVGGQFHTWSDTKILKYNKLNIFASANYPGLYPMLAKGRIDYFPRSVREVGWNLAEYADLDLAIDPHILIQYPSAYYFFVRKGNDELAEDILIGLEKALDDGSFDEMFYAEHSELLERYNVAKRRVFRLHNPLLSTETPIHRAELWINHPKGQKQIQLQSVPENESTTPLSNSTELRAIAD